MRVGRGFVYSAILGCLLLALLLVGPPVPANAATQWRVTRLGLGSGVGIGDIAAVSGHRIAWSGTDFVSGVSSIYVWDSRTNVATRVSHSSGSIYDSHVSWSAGRVYWLRQARDSTSPTNPVNVLSIAPGESRPTLVLARDRRPEGQFFMADDRIAWTEWNPEGTEWSLQTMQLSDTAPRRVAGFRESIDEDPSAFTRVGICLTNAMLAWAEDGSRQIHVTPIDASGRLDTLETIDAGGTSDGNLAADGERLAWSTALKGVHTWKMGDATALNVAKNSGSAIGLDGLAVSGDRIAWARSMGGKSVVNTWETGDREPTVLAVYPEKPDGASVSVPAISGSRVAWAVNYLGRDDDSDAPEHLPPGFIATWKAGDSHPRRVITSDSVDTQQLGLTLQGDRLFYMSDVDSDFFLCLARPGAHPRRAIKPKAPAVPVSGLYPPAPERIRTKLDPVGDDWRERNAPAQTQRAAAVNRRFDRVAPCRPLCRGEDIEAESRSVVHGRRFGEQFE